MQAVFLFIIQDEYHKFATPRTPDMVHSIPPSVYISYCETQHKAYLKIASRNRGWQIDNGHMDLIHLPPASMLVNLQTVVATLTCTVLGHYGPGLVASALGDDPKLVNVHFIARPTADVHACWISKRRTVQLACGDVQRRTGNSWMQSNLIQCCKRTSC
jgi:hypothetical protein